MLKSTQTDKYETACFVQEAAQSSEIDHSKAVIHKTKSGKYFVEFDGTLITFGEYNRMNRWYDETNMVPCMQKDPRIQRLKQQNKWRGEWNHPYPEIKGTEFSDVRMTIPDPNNTSHFINNDRLEGNKYRARITTHPATVPGEAVSSEIIDLHVTPSFSVRLLGRMKPNAPRNTPNMFVTKVITFDMVDFPSHPNADGDVDNIAMEAAVGVNPLDGKIVFLQELAQYCCHQDESMRVVCESFGFTPNEITGISNGGILIAQKDSKFHIPLRGDIRKEAMSILRNRGL